MTEFALPSDFAVPEGITGGPDGNVWFTEQVAFKIGRIKPDGSITEFPSPMDFLGDVPPGAPLEIADGPDGALWFTAGNGGNQLDRITTAGEISTFALPTSIPAQPEGITAGPDGAVWFTEAIAGNIGRIATDGTITEYPIPTAGSDPISIAAGPDGALWFTEYSVQKIGRIATDGTITEYPTSGWPLGIARGPDGAMWFTKAAGNAIARITTGGTESDYPLPAFGPGGNRPVGDHRRSRWCPVVHREQQQQHRADDD